MVRPCIAYYFVAQINIHGHGMYSIIIIIHLDLILHHFPYIPLYILTSPSFVIFSLLVLYLRLLASVVYFITQSFSTFLVIAYLLARSLLFGLF